MERSELAHVLRAASRIVPDQEILVLGSQSILGSFEMDQLPAIVTLSREADLAFWDDEDERKSDLVDGAIGELSQFDDTHGYYGQGVSISTATLPRGWETRLIPFVEPGLESAVAWCLDRHDLALAKLAAQRPKDLTFVDALIDAELVSPAELLGRLEELPVSGILSRRLRSWIGSRAR